MKKTSIDRLIALKGRREDTVHIIKQCKERKIKVREHKINQLPVSQLPFVEPRSMDVACTNVPNCTINTVQSNKYEEDDNGCPLGTHRWGPTPSGCRRNRTLSCPVWRRAVTKKVEL